MAHYWTANDSTEARQMQIEDWLEDLREFGPTTVDSACREWRQLPGGRRPTPGDIRALCIREIAERHVDRMAIEGPLDREAWARSLGWSSYLERQDAISRNAERVTLGLRWQANNAADLRAMRSGDFQSAAAALGVSAREFNPSPEEMAASRRHLGIDPPQAGARDMLVQVEAAISAELVAGEEVRLTGFGTLYPTERAASKGRDPRTSAEIDIAAKRSVKFRPGKALSERLNGAHPYVGGHWYDEHSLKYDPAHLGEKLDLAGAHGQPPG